MAGGIDSLLAGIGQSGFSSTASSSASLLGGSITFAPYSLSPVTGAGNESASPSLGAAPVPWYVWAALVGGVFYVVRRG